MLFQDHDLKMYWSKLIILKFNIQMIKPNNIHIKVEGFKKFVN